jgi:hypothetical protein
VYEYELVTKKKPSGVKKKKPAGVHISGGMKGAAEPAGTRRGRLKSSSRREHARGVATSHHSQVAVDVGEAAPAHAGSLRPRESPMRHFANEARGAVADAAQGLKVDGSTRVARTVFPVKGGLEMPAAKRSVTVMALL